MPHRSDVTLPGQKQKALKKLPGKMIARKKVQNPETL
jgi:hypothetical protein